MVNAALHFEADAEQVKINPWQETRTTHSLNP